MQNQNNNNNRLFYDNDLENLLKMSDTNKSLIINTELPEYLVLAHLDILIKKHNLNYFNFINKKTLIDINLKNKDILLVTNRHSLLSRTFKIQTVLKNENITYVNFRKVIDKPFNKDFDNKKISILITKERKLTFAYNLKTIYICHSSNPLFPKETMDLLINKNKVDLITIFDIEKKSKIVFYDENSNK